MPGRSMRERFSGRRRRVFLAVAIFSLAVFLRVINPGGSKGFIDDLSARQAILALDISHGVYTFPYSGFLFEFDESGLAWLTYPFAVMGAFHWQAFRLFSALSGGLAAAVFSLVIDLSLAARPAFFSGLAYATLPALLLWNRYYINSAADWLLVFGMCAVGLALTPDVVRARHVVGAALCIALGMFLTFWAVLWVPAWFASVFLRFRKQPEAGRAHVWKVTGIFVLALGVFTAPLWVPLVQTPYYVLWRRRHFTEVLQADFLTGFGIWLGNMLNILREFFVSTEHFLRVPPGINLLGWHAVPVALAGVFLLLRSQAIIGWVFLAHNMGWLLLTSGMKQENWRGAYFILAVPFLCLGIGAAAARALDFADASSRSVRWAVSAGITIFFTVNVLLFFFGPFRIPPEDDIIFQLQSDLEEHPDIPCLFSDAVPRIDYYNYPFWFVSRRCLSRVTIFNVRPAGELAVSPDGKRLDVRYDETKRAAFICGSEEVREIRNILEATSPCTVKKLRCSGLWEILCSLDVGEAARRTWRKTAIPPILALEYEERK